MFSSRYTCYLNQQICVQVVVSGMLLSEMRVMSFARSSGVFLDFILGFIFSQQKLPDFTSCVTQRFGFDPGVLPPACSLLTVTEKKYVSRFSGGVILFF